QTRCPPPSHSLLLSSSAPCLCLTYRPRRRRINVVPPSPPGGTQAAGKKCSFSANHALFLQLAARLLSQPLHSQLSPLISVIPSLLCRRPHCQITSLPPSALSTCLRIPSTSRPFEMKYHNVSSTRDSPIRPY